MKKIVMLCTLMIFMLVVSACRTAEYNSHNIEESIADNSLEAPPIESSEEIDSTKSGMDKDGAMYTAIGRAWNPEEKTVLGVFPIQNPTSVNKELGSNKRGISYQGDNALLSFDTGMLTYSLSNSGNMSEVVYSVLYIIKDNPSDGYYNADRFSNEMELSFCSRDKAAGQISSILQKLGLDNEYEITVLSLDYKTMNEQTSIIKKAYGLQDGMIKKWTEENECYYIQAVPKIEDIPLISFSHGSTQDGTYITGEQIKAVITNKGLEFLMISNAVNIDYLSLDDVNIISKDKAMNIFEGLNASLLTDESYTIENIELGYYPEYAASDHSIVKFSPSWVAKTLVSGESGRENGEKYSYISAQYLDAQTGGEIVEDMG